VGGSWDCLGNCCGEKGEKNRLVSKKTTARTLTHGPVLLGLLFNKGHENGGLDFTREEKWCGNERTALLLGGPLAWEQRAKAYNFVLGYGFGGHLDRRGSPKLRKREVSV